MTNCTCGNEKSVIRPCCSSVRFNRRFCLRTLIDKSVGGRWEGSSSCEAQEMRDQREHKKRHVVFLRPACQSKNSLISYLIVGVLMISSDAFWLCIF